MARYRYTWPTDYGWNLRLDIIPYDGTLDDASTALEAGTVLALGALDKSFDELPIGLMNAPTMDVTLNWSRLPSALQTRLMNITSGNDRFCFLFFTDRGTGGVTYTLEFCGTLADEQTAEYSQVVDEEGNLTDEYQVTLDLVDSLHHIMSTRSGTIFDGSVYSPSDGRKWRHYWEYVSPTSGNFYDEAFNDVIADYSVSSFAHIMARMRTSLSSVFNADYARTTNATEISDADAIDSSLELDTLITTGTVFYRRLNSDASNAKGTALDEDTALFATHVYGDDGTVLGGLWDNNDEYGWYSASAVIDIVKDLCETLCVKATYIPTYVADAGGDFIRYTWNVAAIGDTSDAFTSPQSVSLTKATKIGAIAQGDTSIQKAESRWDLSSARWNFDVTGTVAVEGASRSSRSFNFEPIIHNIPSYKDVVIDRQNVRLKGLYQTNRVSFEGFGKMCKAHEETVVNLSNLDGITYSISFDTLRPTFTERGDEESLSAFPRDNGRYTAWLNIAQQAASGACVAEAVLSAFSSPLQGGIEVEYPITYSANVRPQSFGNVHSLSGGPASVFTHLPWARACMTGMTCDYTTGRVTVNYIMVSIS